MHPQDTHVRKMRREMLLGQTWMHRRLILNVNISFDVQIIWNICCHRMKYLILFWSINKRQALFFNICNLKRPIIIKDKIHQGYLLFTIALQFKCIFMFFFSTEMTSKVSVIIYMRKMCSFSPDLKISHCLASRKVVLLK